VPPRLAAVAVVRQEEFIDLRAGQREVGRQRAEDLDVEGGDHGRLREIKDAETPEMVAFGIEKFPGTGCLSWLRDFRSRVGTGSARRSNRTQSADESILGGSTPFVKG